MSRFVLKIGVVMEVLQELVGDRARHVKDARWAEEITRQLCGPVGFVNLVTFAVDADFAVATLKLVREQDRTMPDVALCCSQVLHCVETCQALFNDCHIFDEAPNGTYTNQLLHSLRGLQRRTVLGGGQEGL